MSTAVELAVACAPVTQGARVRSPVGTTFLGGFFRGFSSSVRQTSGNFRPTSSLNNIWSSKSFFHIRPVRMNGCVDGVYRLSSLYCLGGGPGTELIPHPGKPSMCLCDHKSLYVVQRLIPSPDRSWLCKVRAA